MLAEDRLATARLRRVAQNGQLEKVRAYVWKRLREESEAQGRGYQQQILERTPIKSSTLSVAIQHGLKMGNQFCHHMADFWGMSYAELEAIALGKPVPGPQYDPPILTLLSKVGRGNDGLPGLRDAIEANPGRWRTSTVARAISVEWDSVSNGEPRDGWPKVLDSIESGDIDRMAGGAKEAVAKAKRQMRGRPRIPVD
jgi:hypothetical protein